MNRTQRTRNRQDYTPQVRATRPPTSPHLSEIKRKYVTMVDTATATELIAAVTDRKIRIVRIKIVRQSGTGSAHLELYFGTAADISTADSNGDAIIDLLRMDTSEDGCWQSAQVGQIRTREDYYYEELRGSSLRVLL